MELVLKLHDRMKPDETPLQEMYRETAIGFDKLFELDSRGLKTTRHDLKFAEAWALCEAENQAERYPLVSLPSYKCKSILTDDAPELLGDRHMFITLIGTSHLRLFFHSYGSPSPSFAEPRDIQRRVLAIEPEFVVNLTSYTLEN